MGTRAAAFAGKISNLRESILRIQNGTMPQPTCLDLANMLRYFCQVLHDFRDFKDIENIPLYAHEKRDRMQLIKTLPNFDYCGLYRTLSHLVDILPLIPPSSNGLEQLGGNLLSLFTWLVSFLDHANMETMPYLVSTLFMSLPATMHKDILDTLCFNLLPFTIDQQHKSNPTGVPLAGGSGGKRRPSRKGGNNTNLVGREQKMMKPVHCIVRIEDSNDDPNPTPSSAAGDTGSKLPTKDSHEDQGIGLDMQEPSTAAGSQQNQSTDYNNNDEIEEDEEYALLSVTSILMIAFHYITEPMHHSQLIECLMKLKSNVFEDLLYVIAYGTTRARCPAVEILFRYWPDICPSQQDRKNNSQANKLRHIGWQPTKCQNKNCSLTSSLGDNEAVKMCLDFKMSITLSDMPPPMLICLDCVDLIYKQQSGYQGDGPIQAMDDYSSKFIDLLLPMEQVSKLCENKKCKSSSAQEKTAIGTCFDIECANYNCKKPIRYCRTCFVTIHEACKANNYDPTLQSHIRHSSINLNLMDNEDSVNNFIEAIISLLKEAAPADRPLKDSERYLRSLMGPMSQFNTDTKDMNIATEEKQLISQYGIWLMAGLCRDVDKISDDLLGRLLGMLFQWFHFTACLPDDQAGSALEKLKGECINGWIMDVKKQRNELFVSCLLPHPIDCSKIGGHWEVWPDTAHQIKEGFKRLLCLVPYDIITSDVWDDIMPCWMECFRHEVPENELNELKILLSKVFDPELSPLGFKTKQMYNFISSRFEDSSNTNQEQTLYWLQIITMLEIPIPIDFLFQMLKSGVKSLAHIRNNELNKIKIAFRLASLDKLPGSGRSSMSTSRSVSSGTGSDDSSSSSSASRSPPTSGASTPTSHVSQVSQALSMPEDDSVLLPSTSQDGVSHGGGLDSATSGQLSTRPQVMTHKERQAQARAAFSASVLQHVSQLDGVSHNQLQSTSLSSPSSMSPSVNTQLNQLAPQASSSSSNQAVAAAASGTQQVAPTTTRGTLAPAAAHTSSHNRPLKSTTDSLSSYHQRHHHQHHGSSTAATNKPQTKDSTSAGAGATSSKSKPKLKLQISSVEEYMTNKVDNNLICYILMMDILLKQLDLQEINAHRGLDGKEAQQAIELLNAIISTPWIGRHTCCDSLPQSNASPSQQQMANLSINSTGRLDSSSNPTAAAAAAAASTTGDSKPEAEGATSANIHKFSHCAQGFENEDFYESCVFCEIISTFHQLGMFLIEFFAPVIEVSICEVSQEAANGEFDGKPDYSRIGLDHLGPSPKDATNVKFSFNHKEQHQQQQIPEQHQPPAEPTTPFSPSYTGPSLKPEVLQSLSKELQLCYNLLVQFHQYQTPDIVSQLLQMIKLISLHSQVLSKASKSNPQFITWCQHNMLVSKLWSLCQLESSEIARTCVPLLLHCITLPWGVRLFRDLVERDFNSDNWLSRFRAVERVVTIAYFCEPSTIKNSTLLQSTMASAFCYVVRCLDDIEAIVAQRALVSLEMMKTSSLKLLLWCLEVQFDYIIIDRPMILRSVFQLYNHLRDRRFLTWEFFLNRFDTIFLEAQIYLQQTGEIPSFTMQDLKNTNTKSEIYQKKIMRAKEALQETHHSRSLSSRFNEKQFSKKATHSSDDDAGKDSGELAKQYKQSIKLQQQLHKQQSTSGGGSDNNNLGTPPSNQKLDTASAKGGGIEKRRSQSPVKRVMQHGKSTSSRYQSVAYLTSQSVVKRTNSKFMTNLAMQSVPPLMLPDKLHQHLPNSFVDDGSKLNEIAQENHVFGVVHRVCDEDRDTNHSLIFLLMQFFSKPDPSHPQTIKTLTRSHQIVLRHLNILMGYSIARKNFLIPATNLRLLPVFNAFLTSLPKVLDFNYSLGSILLDTCLPVLIYCPAPDNVQFDTLRTPNYSLWLLNPLMRQSWLMAVMAFLYKYQFGQPHLKDHVNMLMWIVINTLEMHLNSSTLEVALDRCLVNVRDSTATVGSNEDHSSVNNNNTNTNKVNLVAGSSQPEIQQPQATTSATSGAAATSTTIVNVESPMKESRGPKASETIEMTQQQQQARDGDKRSSKDTTSASVSMVVPSSVSTSSFRNKPTSLEQQTSSFTTTAASTSKSLMKADTSDSLNVKAKLIQRKAESPSKGGSGGGSAYGEGKMSSANASSSRINADRASEIVVPTPEVRPSPKKTVDSANTSDERLLPIGIHPLGVGGNKTRSNFDLPAAERLLPIGVHSTPFSRTNTTIQEQKQSAQPTPTSIDQRGKEFRHHSASPGKTNLPNSGEPGSSPSAAVVSGSRTQTATTELGHQQSGTIGVSAQELPQQPTALTKVVVASHQEQHQPSAKILEKLGATGEGVTMDLISSTGKNNRRRFGAGPKHSDGAGGKQQSSKDLDGQDQMMNNSTFAASASGTTTKSTPFVGGGRKGKANKMGAKEYYPKQVSTVQPSFSSPSLLNEQLAQINRYSLIQEFSDKDLSMCLVILETFIHHEPSMAAQMLPNILRLVARYSAANSDASQMGSSVNSVGGSMFVARQFIRVALYDLMENNIFHQIFTSHFTGYEFYKSMATALADIKDSKGGDQKDSKDPKELNQLAPLSKLFEDLNKQKNLPQAASLMTILENVATYFECIINESTTNSLGTWSIFITNWEEFLRKLILALPRYSGSTITTTSGSRSDGTSSMAHANPGSGGGGGGGPSAIGQAGAATGGGSGGGTGSASTNQFLAPKTTAGGQENVNATSANAIPSSCSMIMAPIMRIILSTSKISHLALSKTIVDPYSKIISYTVLNSQFKYEHLLEINHNCCRLYTRDREKYLIQRTIAYELVQVLKFRFFILEENLLILLLFMLQDVGGTLAPHVVRDSLKIDQATLNQAESYMTNVSECLRQNIGDLLEFITDVHAISRINDNLIGSQPSCINRDSFGGHVKAAISQYLALEMSLNSGADNRTVLRYLPWLYASPSLQQGPREFIDCVSHIRQLSWIILGSLQHSTLMRGAQNGQNSAQSNHYGSGSGLGGGHSAGGGSQVVCQPIPIEKNGNVAEHVQVILAGFAEQSKESVLHMSGLFHAFLLCQLWTMYCENICLQHPPNSEQYQFSQSTLDDFWAKITPGVLRLVGHSRVMSEMVSTHFLQLIESLIESNSSILIRYLPMWNSVFYSYKRRNKSGNLAIRLQKCIEWQPPDLNEQDLEQNNKRLINWLEKVQYKMSHIEIQSSQAAPFYLT